MHTTGTTSPEGVHQLAPNLGERRPMEPPSGGHFKMPAGYGPSPAPSPEGSRAVQPQLDATQAAPQVILPPANVLVHTPQQPPALAGYQSAPTHVPPGMVAQAVFHDPSGQQGGTATPLLAAPYQHTGTPYPSGPTTLWPTHTGTMPRPLGPMEVAPPQRVVTYPHPADIVLPHNQPTAAPLTIQPQTVHTHLAQNGITVRLEGDSQALEAALGMLMLRGVRVAVVG